MNNYSLALSLMKANTEEEVITILKTAGYWDSEESWREIDKNRGNYSTIGNQQSNPEQALVEKVINSVDAVLMRECWSRGITPVSSDAPSDIAEAQHKYFGIRNGKLTTIDAGSRSKIAENIYLMASGRKKDYPTIAIFDSGEGQYPSDFHSTFLALNRGNKNSIRFVQGKYGMGGTGALCFSSPKFNLQFILSKRHPEVVKNEKIQKSDWDEWGFTVVRRNDPSSTMRSSYYTYLAPDSEILTFSRSSIPLIPSAKNSVDKTVEAGSYIRLYEYQLSTGRLRSDITRHLHNQLSLLLPDIALPIKVVDTRYENSPIKTLHGLSTRLDDDKSGVIENGFPTSGMISIDGEDMEVAIYLFKPGRKEKDSYPKRAGVIFTLNGQTHAILDKYFFERPSVEQNFLSDSILVIVDCSKIDRRKQEDLFMTSRDRLRSNPLREKIESRLARELKDHPGLKEYREKRKREEIKERLADSKPIREIVQSLIQKSPSLTSLLITGRRISNPFRIEGKSKSAEYRGNKYPSYFRLKKKYGKSNPKQCEISSSIRIQYDTDVQNDYFSRDIDPGSFSLSVEDIEVTDYSLNLWCGTATLSISLPAGLVKPGDIIKFRSEVSDHTLSRPFADEFFVLITEEHERVADVKRGKRISPPSMSKGSESSGPEMLDIPEVFGIHRDEWSEYAFDENSALKVRFTDSSDGYRYYVNVDNVYLQHEIKANPKVSSEVMVERFKVGMMLIGMALLRVKKSDSSERMASLNQENSLSIYEQIEMTSSAIAPFLLPMIATLGEL